MTRTIVREERDRRERQWLLFINSIKTRQKNILDRQLELDEDSQVFQLESNGRMDGGASAASAHALPSTSSVDLAP